MLNIDIKHLGNIKKANIKLNNLVIFTGESNSGKTYLNYMLYALLDQRYSFGNSGIFLDIVKQAKENGLYEINLEEFIKNNIDKIVNGFKNSFKKSLPQFFSTTADMFKNFDIDFIEKELYNLEDLKMESISISLTIGKGEEICEIIKDSDSLILSIVIKDAKVPNDVYVDFLEKNISKMIMKPLYHNTFILPAERSGLSLFYQELNSKRNALINNLQKAQINPMDVIKDLIISKYPQPIADFIEFLNDTQYLKKSKSELSDITNYLHFEIINGKYKVDKDGIQFMPYKTSYKSNNFQDKIDLHLSSSTVKTFFSLDFYIMHLAKIDDVLIIDEPELNLHPDNQRKVARLLARVVNAGVKVILSTHSDYIIKELNNLIMLSDEFPSKQELMKKYKYSNDEILKSEDVNAYLVKDGEVKALENNTKEGIIATTFDEVINKLNNSSDDIYYTKQEEMNHE